MTFVHNSDAQTGTATGLMPDSQSALVYAGTFDRQIHALRFNTRTGRLTPIGQVEAGLRSTWLLAHPTLPILYAVDDQNTQEGSITAFHVDRDSGTLTKINMGATAGMGSTYMAYDPLSRTLLTANYASGSVSSIAVEADGRVGPLVSTVAETGSGPNKRQASAHAHSVAIDPSGRYALVPDLGADRVFIYHFDRATRKLSRNDGGSPLAFAAPAGAGPRHLAFGADGKYVYVITELSAEVMVLRWDQPSGKLSVVQTIPISGTSCTGQKSGAGIAVSHDGRFVYVVDRGEDALIAYQVDAALGTLKEIQRLPSGGQRPWSFAIDSSGKWMLVDNAGNGSVNVFAIDTASGRLSNTGYAADIPSVVSVAFVE